MSEYTQNGDAIFRDGELVYDGVDPVNSSRIVDLLTEIDALRAQLHEITFFSYRVDGRLSAEYEKGWNDAVTEITKKAMEYFTAQGIDAETDMEETLERDKVITALREKLAAAEADIAGKRAVIEASKAAINGQIKDCLKVEDDYANFRATVAAALAELRTQWNAQYQHYVSKTDDSSWERRQELLTRMRELEFIIAKLDLPEAAPASCTWTPDDDGNYATGCDGLFVVLKDSLAGYQMASCCFCGKPIKVQQ